MKSKFLLIISFLFLLGMVWIIPVKGEVKTVSREANRDCYVNQGVPDKNYWGSEFLVFGNISSHLYETYLNFFTHDPPENWTSVRIYFEIYFISEPLDFTISLVMDNWTETGVTWNNKPTPIKVITTLTVSEAKIYSIDMSGHTSDLETSICIKPSDPTQTSFAFAWSTDAAGEDSNRFYPPQIIWTYGEPDPNSFPSYDLVIVFGSIIGITLFIIWKKKSSKNLKVE